MADSIFTQMGSVIKNSVDTKVATEETRATTAESGLQTNIDTLETNTNTALNTKLNTTDTLTPVATDNKIITQADVKPSGLFEQGLF